MAMAANLDNLDFDLDARDNVFAAIDSDDADTLRWLIRTRFGTNRNSNTDCLYHAVNRGNLEMVKILLDAGISRVYYYSINQDQIGEDNLDLNPENMDDLFVEVLALQAQEQARSRVSPLNEAYALEDPELRWKMINLLVEHGVSPANEHLYSESTVYRAAANGDCEMMKYLFDAGAEINCPRDYGRGYSPLHMAVRFLDGEVRIEMVKLLIEMGANVNATGPIFRESVLQLVSKQEYGRCEVLKLLLDAGAHLNYLDARHHSPLAYAAFEGDCEFMSQMIAAGADVNLWKGCCGSPLYNAVLEYKRDAVQLLLESGTNPNSMDRDGENILSFAAEFDNESKELEYIDILRLLLAHGAKINCTQQEDKLPFVSVLRSGTMQAMQLFFEYGGTLENCGSSYLLHHAAENRDKDILKYLLKTHRYDVNGIYSKLDEQYTPLFIAVDAQEKHNVKSLIKWGADVNIPAFYSPENGTEVVKTSPLLQALDMGSWEIADLLLSAGADIDVDTINEVLQRTRSQVSIPQYRKTFDLLIGEATLIRSKKYFDSHENILMNSFANFSPEIEAQCLVELKSMRNIIFCGSLTLYDLLRRKDVIPYMNSSHVTNKFESQKVLEYFPMYGNRIENCYLLAKSKRKVMDIAMKRLDEILRFRFRHYDEILYIILSHFRLDDLQCLKKSKYQLSESEMNFTCQQCLGDVHSRQVPSELLTNIFCIQFVYWKIT